MFEDIGRRFAADGRRIYLTGHSGGSRVAMEIALTHKEIAGVIASSAGYPDARPRAAVAFPIFGTAGTDDFNYIEMRMLARPLKSPHRLVIFKGGHTLPPPDVALQAIAWLELQAMASGLRVKDETLIDQCWSNEDRAVAAAGETATAVQLLRAMADDFRALRDVKAIEARASELARRKEIKRALDRERDDDEKEARTLDDFAQYQADLANDTLRSQTLQTLNRLLANLHAQATAAEESAERSRARRVLRLVAMNGMERSQDADYSQLLQRYRLPAPPR
jgi:pimeloyl-ACP methyl ester carboxylesterase